jgi:hypothetical protein
MELRLEINADIEYGLNRLVEQYGHDKEYYMVKLAQTGIRNLENAFWADSDIDPRDVMSKYASED